MPSYEQTRGMRSGKLLGSLIFLVAVIALTLAIIEYMRVQDVASREQTYIVEGGVSLQNLSPELAQRLENVIASYENDQDSADISDAQAIALDTNGEDVDSSDDSTSSMSSTLDQATQGLQGAQGVQGIQGERGADGATGAQGERGEKGIKGVEGDTGAQGQKGQQGESGLLATVLGNGLSGNAVDQSLNLSLVTGDGGGISVGANGLALASSCSAQQTLHYLGGSWVCSADSNTDTTYTSGVGLVLDNANFVASAPICTANEKLLWSGISFICENDIDTISENKTIAWDEAARTLSVNPGNSLVIPDNNTTYTAGQGLSLSESNAFSLNLDGVTTISSPSNQDQILVDTGDGLRKVSYNDLFADLLGALSYRGIWNASTNTPNLTDYCQEATRGHYFVVSEAGSTELHGVSSWGANDWAVCNGSEWQRIVNSIPVSSVFGRTGAITAQTGDYAASQITFEPSSVSTATNFQDALQEVKDGGVSSELPSGSLLIGDVNNTARAVSLSGDATVSNTGVITIASGAITTDKLAPGAVDGSAIADGSIHSSEISDGAVTFAKWNSNDCTVGQVPKYTGSAWGCGTDENGAVIYLAGDGVTISDARVVTAALGTTINSSEIVAGAVSTDQLADSAVTSQKILNGAVEFDHWASSDCTEGQVPQFDGSGWVCGSTSRSGIGESAGRGSPLASAIANTEVTVGELTFRYNRNISNGDLEVRSASGDQVALRASREGRYPSAGPNVRPVQSITAQANTGTFTEIYAGGANPNELLLYEIWTENQIYLVQIGNFQGQRIQMWVWAS